MSNLITAAVQIALNNGWENNKPVIHMFASTGEAISFCENLSHQFGNASVRLTYPSNNIAPINITAEYVSRLNGAYIQSRIANLEHGYRGKKEFQSTW